MDCQNYFRGKRITLMGLGLLGRGIGDAKFLAESGADLIVTDLKTKRDLASSLRKLKSRSRNLKAITYVLGKHRLKDFKNRDLIIKAAGVPFDSPYLIEAKRNKIPILMSTTLFVKFAVAAGVKIIGVTGTRGKTTVAKLIYEILSQELPLKIKDQRVTIKIKPKVWLGGNAVGISTLALLPKVKPGGLGVLELDSWQLQGFGDLKISPDIAVFTNLMPDHLNYYSGNMKRYFEDKKNIYKYQDKSGIVFVGREIAGKIKSFGRKVVPSTLPRRWKLKLPGEHNRLNAAFAVAVARNFGVPEKVIKKVIVNFPGAPGRLELIRTWQGIKIYNDTTATTPDAVVAALKALNQPGKIILIAGGADKNFPNYSLMKLSELLPDLKQVVLLPGTGTARLMKIQDDETNSRTVDTLREALQAAIGMSKNGDIILLSPGFASFGLFQNEYDRGAQFVKIVRQLP